MAIWHITPCLYRGQEALRVDAHSVALASRVQRYLAARSFICQREGTSVISLVTKRGRAADAETISKALLM